MEMLGRHRLIKFTVLVWGLLLTAMVQAEVFQCRDTAGSVRFQDRPCAGDRVAATDQRPSPVPSHAQPQADSGNHFFWRAESDQGTLYLLGSIHFGIPQMYPLPRVMTSAFKQSDALVVEADVFNADPQQTAELVASKAFYQDGSRLHDHLSAQTWQHLEQVAGALGMPVAILDMQKPWFVSMTLTAVALKQLGFSEDKGIDAHFLNLARGKKKVVELESMAMQLSLFERMSMAEQVAMLEETLREVEHGKAFFDKMLGYWQRGDVDGVQSLFDEGMMNSPAGERLNQIIIIDRNRQMSEKLHALAQQGGRYFVVVGAGHLTGPEGIVALLRQRGYRLSQY